MKFEGSETPSERPRANGQPSVAEVLYLKDRDGHVLKQFTKNDDGSLTEETVSVTPAVARVITATIDTALSDDDSMLHFGNLRVVEGVDIAGDDDGTDLFAFLAANLEKIPAEDFVDNNDGSCDIVMRPGANTVAFTSGDSKLTFEETTAGVDAVSVLVEDVSGVTVDAWNYKGATDCSTNPNYPDADAGDLYKVSVAGKIGGGSGTAVSVGDIFVCNTDGTTTGTEAQKGTKWDHFPATADIDIAAITHAATAKTTPADNDEIPIVDSAASNVLKKVTWANIKATLKAYFDTLYPAISQVVITAAKVFSVTNTLTFSGTDGTTMTFPGVSSNIGYLESPINSQSNDYTCVLADSGKTVLETGASKTITIPANASVAYPVGTVLSFICTNASGCSIAITSDTMTLVNSTTTGTRTLAQNGMASAIKMTSTTWLIAGAGLT